GIGLMHNLRFFSAEVRTDIQVEVKDKKIYYNGDVNARDFSKDTVHERIYEEDRSPGYKKSYFQTLLKMFPSHSGNISIETEKTNSFYMFLKGIGSEEKVNQILASLLLLSEGINVLLTIESAEEGKKELVLASYKDKSLLFKIKLKEFQYKDIMRDEVGVFDVYGPTENEAVEVIEFFIKNRRNSYKQQNTWAEPTDFNEYSKGKFMYSTGFLIQTYIYEYFNDPEDMIDFIRTVHDMLMEHMDIDTDLEDSSSDGSEPRENVVQNVYYTENSGRFSYATPILNRCIETVMCTKEIIQNSFIGKRWKPVSGYISAILKVNQKILCKNVYKKYFMDFRRYSEIRKYFLGVESLQPVLNQHKKILFQSTKQIRIAESTQQFKRKEFTHIPISKAIYINPVRHKDIIIFESNPNYAETVILFLFCLVAYNPNNQIFDISHLLKALKDLKWFFQKYRNMFSEITQEIENDWNKVVADIDADLITYTQENRNNLENHLLNILAVVAKLAGVYERDMLRLEIFSIKLSYNNPKEDENTILEIGEYMRSLFADLSNGSIHARIKHANIVRNIIKVEDVVEVKCSVFCTLLIYLNDKERIRPIEIRIGVNTAEFGIENIRDSCVDEKSKKKNEDIIASEENKIGQPKLFLDCIYLNYIKAAKICNDEARTLQLMKFLSENRVDIERSDFININPILMDGKIEPQGFSLSYIDALSDCFIKLNLPETHNMFRVISKILKSAKRLR
ncbi:hypothetical protein NEAUS05_2439, partial [Nematocida ausubeli]